MGHNKKRASRQGRVPSTLMGPAQKPVPREPQETSEINVRLIWAINLLPCAGLIYVQGWTALKYVYWIWLLELWLWRFDFAFFVYITSSIAATALALASCKDWKTKLEQRYAEYYPNQIEYNRDDGGQHVRKFQRSSSEAKVVEASGLYDDDEFLESLNADTEANSLATEDSALASEMSAAKTEAEKNAIRSAKIKLKLKEGTEAAQNDTARSAAAFMSTNVPQAQSDFAATSAQNSTQPVQDENAYIFSLSPSPLPTTGSGISVAEPSTFSSYSTYNSSYETPDVVPGSLAKSVLSPTAWNESLPSPASLLDEVEKAAPLLEASYSAPQLHSLDSFMTPLPSGGQQNCDKCGAERNPNFSFCITCGRNF